ncbi:MAG: TetR/AcrR family transcriptional regulator C-terminal domain-containing protein [Gracilibacteraceae bacterium]|jgi:AcrR family transcriptional regulator|nr:TetR/AcrR family transcriptional regulator C-terminal domain-containing protein [Gracilibacteraceae bacterium]
MAQAVLTKNLIADCFKELAMKNPVYKISVKDIIAASKINKNTFYYHFLDKEDLVVWIFRSELGTRLKKVFPEEKLICKTGLMQEKYNSKPFYLDMRSPQDNLELGMFWHVFGGYLFENDKYYANVLNIGGQNNLVRYIYAIYSRQIEKDIIYFLGRRRMPIEAIRFLADYFTNSCCGWLLNSTGNNTPNHVRCNDERFRNMSHEFMQMMVEKYAN